MMELAGFGGNDLIARTLIRAGWKISARTVGRIRKRRWPPPRRPEPASTVPRAVWAKHPNQNLLEKIELGRVHYAHFRPHQALGGAIPADVYFGRIPIASLQIQVKPQGGKECPDLESPGIQTPPVVDQAIRRVVV
jgi:hypothetical protein